MKKLIAGAGTIIALAFAAPGVAHADTTTALPGAGYLAYLANTGQLQALLGQVTAVVKIPQTLPAPQDLIAPAAAGFLPPVITSVQLPAVPLPVALPPVALPVALPPVQQFIPPAFQPFIIPPVVSSYLP